MLTTDHVLCRRRGDRLQLIALRPEQRATAEALAAAYVDAAERSVGARRADFDARCDEVDVGPRDRRLADGLRKLVTNRCRFAVPPGEEPAALRRALFAAAAAARRDLGDGAELDRDAVVARTAAEHGLAAEALEERLFADLRQAHRLEAFEPIGPGALLARWRLGQAQAVLLKAVGVAVEVDCDRAAAYRALFHKLKFHRLLFSVHGRAGGGYRIEIDGPFSLFRSVTRYGLQLALLLPTLDECCAWRLEADVIWGADRRRLRFELDGGRRDAAPAGSPVGEELATLMTQFQRLDNGWQVDAAARVLDLPGVGLCVPDLLFTHRATGAEVHLEVMGYWSREAVWRRIELVERGLDERILFAVSDRLRVSEQALGDHLPGALYVYKGVMSARRIAERLQELSERS